MKIEKGKFYKTRDGRKVGPMRDDWNYESLFKFHVTVGELDGDLWEISGKNYRSAERDLVSLWQDETPSPIQSKTVTEIAHGTYGHVSIIDSCTKYVRLSVNGGLFEASELRAAALTLTQLADFLEEQGK